MLEVDSPEQEPADDIEDYGDIDELSALPPATTASMKKPGKLHKAKEKPREDQLQYMDSVPYECESLHEMDRRLEEIVRRLIDCVRAKD
jgi:proteasome activator subunit 4